MTRVSGPNLSVSFKKNAKACLMIITHSISRKSHCRSPLEKKTCRDIKSDQLEMNPLAMQEPHKVSGLAFPGTSLQTPFLLNGGSRSCDGKEQKKEPPRLGQKKSKWWASLLCRFLDSAGALGPEWWVSPRGGSCVPNRWPPGSLFGEAGSLTQMPEVILCLINGHKLTGGNRAQPAV